MPSTNGHGPQSERVALYLRVSSEEQRDRETIEIQREFLEQYRCLYKLEVANIYEDDGVSGTIPLHERPEGRRLLEDAREGKLQTVLVYRLDRLGRSLLVIVDAHDRLQTDGVALRSATEPIDTSTPSGRLIFQMLASFAEYERSTIAERTRAGLHRAYRNGKQTGLIPYAYRVDDSGRFVIMPHEAEMVRQIIANIAQGATLYSESKRLNDEGITPPGWRYRSGRSARRPASKHWAPPTVRNLVHQHAYSGTHEVKINGGKDIIAREVPAIVGRALQEQAISRLAENKRYSGGKKHRDYLLRGLVVCDTCGCACTGRTTTRGRKKYPYYKCSDDNAQRSYRGPMHRAPHVNADWLEQTVWADVRQFLKNPGEVLERVRAHLSDDDTRTEDLARRDDLSKRLASKQAEKDRYVRAYAQGHISEEELAEYMTDLKNQFDNLRLLLQSVEDDLAATHEESRIAASTEAWLMTLRQCLAEVEGDSRKAFEQRRQLVRLLVQQITAGRDKKGHTQVQITYRFAPPSEGVVVTGIQETSRSSAENGYGSSGSRTISGCAASTSSSVKTG